MITVSKGKVLILFFRTVTVTALSICVGLLILIVFALAIAFCITRRNNNLKRKTSEESLTRVGYDPNSDSVEILEGRDYLEELRQRVLIDRLEAGIETPVEELDRSFATMFTSHQTVEKEGYEQGYDADLYEEDSDSSEVEVYTRVNEE